MNVLETMKRARGRTGAWAFAVGTAIGVLVAGLIVPFAVDDGDPDTGSATNLAAGADPIGGVGDDDVTSTAGVSATSVPDAVAGGAGPASPPGSGGRTELPAAGSGVSPSGVVLTESDKGVTPEAIRVGALVLDIATVGRLGVGVAIDPEQQMAAFKSFFDEINARGGIHGRKIEGHYEAYDVTSTDDQLRACKSLTQDKKVFTVLGGFNTVIPNLCVTEENETPLISNASNFPDWVFQRSGGRLVTLFPRSGRMMANLVRQMERVKLADKKVGILTDELNDPKGIVLGQLEAALEERQHTVVYKGVLSADIPTASSQTPVEVQKAKSSGAEVIVFLNSNAVYGTAFVSQARDQGYNPQYVNSDWASNNGDSTNQNMPQNYEGAWGFTSVHGLGNKIPPKTEPPEAAKCRQRYDKFSGRKLAPMGNTEYGITINFCDTVRIFEALAVAAGPNLTRPRLTAALPSLSGYVAAGWGGGTFHAGKSDYSDLVRTERWKFSCKCWDFEGGFRPASE